MKLRSLLTTLALFTCLPAPAIADKSTSTDAIPRTSEGHPDFQGTWTSRWLTPVERLPEATTLVVDEAEGKRLAQGILERAAHPSQLDPELAYPDATSLAIVRGEYRTSIIVSPEDGKLPFKKEGRMVIGKYISGLDGPEQRMTTERCIGGVGWAPLQIRYASMIRNIVQTPQHLLIHTEAYSDLRVIGIDAPPRPSAIKPPGGDSTAHWDGDALIVKTKNLAARFSTHGIVTVLSPDATVEERFEYASPDEIVYRYTITDPTYYTTPWTGEYSLMRSHERVHEFACHEGNYSMAGMLGGARREDTWTKN